MKGHLRFLLIFAAAGPLAAQSRTGEFRVQGVGAYAPAVSQSSAYQDPIGPPQGSSMAGLQGDLSFILGRFRFGPEGAVLRGPERRVWSLGGVARYELGNARLRPYAVLGGGASFWDREYLIDLPPQYGGPYPSWGSDVSIFTMSGGGGVVLGALGGRVAATAELRVHTSLFGRKLTGSRSMVSLGLGGRVAW